MYVYIYIYNSHLLPQPKWLRPTPHRSALATAHLCGVPGPCTDNDNNDNNNYNNV